MKRLTSAEIKETIFNIMVYFDKLCRKHNLKYFLAGGTCLGAVRHKDFIPWDDDADIFMDRENYDKFREVMKTENSQYKLLCYQDSEGYFYPYYKLVDTRTVVKEKFLKKIPDMGVYLDIFPVDGVPNDDNLTKKLLKKCQSYHYQIIINNLFISFGSKRFTKKIDDAALKYPVENCKRLCCSVWGGPGTIFDKELASELVELPFHGYNFYVMKDYDQYLSRKYGDYMTLPPKNKQKPHGYFAALKD